MLLDLLHGLQPAGRVAACQAALGGGDSVSAAVVPGIIKEENVRAALYVANLIFFFILTDFKGLLIFSIFLQPLVSQLMHSTNVVCVRG